MGCTYPLVQVLIDGLFVLGYLHGDESLYLSGSIGLMAVVGVEAVRIAICTF